MNAVMYGKIKALLAAAGEVVDAMYLGDEKVPEKPVIPAGSFDTLLDAPRARVFLPERKNIVQRQYWSPVPLLGLQEVCRAKGISLDGLAKKMNVSGRETVMQWMTGRSNPTRNNRLKLEQVLGVPYDRLLKSEDDCQMRMRDIVDDTRRA